ncbi:pseudouridylate synthase TRUB2, mitochondrial-like [Neocloeon triangulifer]|uniref:pseudouridylate synthase TRUB2, mitochondrial-like n=1 Tax=Neocloeon triangulifer TaxID=2078957 RepID=UPI00286EB7C1|nr:pseudouridylate synthase TRUB2, mitochondrial-like [Neocloeon triangulifer]XP_059482424.1 pseudouridylate synthase TRUB2, mitochondrial-like [Neocloeon triangulifer]
MMKSSIDASLAWRHLSGIICAYKPPRKSISQLKETVKAHLSRDLNKMKVRPPTPYVLIDTDQKNLEKAIGVEDSVKVIPSYSDNVLVTGPRYIREEIKCNYVHGLGFKSSGVMLLGINGGCRAVRKKNYFQLLRVYQIGVRLGLETNTGWYDEGMGVARAPFKHVPPQAINTVLSAYQASHMRTAFELAGVLPDSQEAFDLATQGLVKPKTDQGCVIYNARLLDFRPPDFTIEFVTLNETEEYFLDLVTELGRRLRSTAATRFIKCIQIGNFGVEHSLSTPELNLQNILKNMRLCWKLTKENKELFDLQELEDISEEKLDIYEKMTS